MSVSKIIGHKNAKIALPIVLVAVIFAAYEGYLWINTQSTDNAYIEADISNVSSEISGVIEKIYVKENSFVKDGQIIAEINKNDYQAKYEQAQFALSRSIHNINMIEQNIKLALITQNKAIEAHEFAEENFSVAETEYKRITRLNREKFASKKSLDDAKIAYEKVKNELSQMALDVQSAKENLALLELKKLVAISEKNNAEQVLHVAKRALENTNIRAPIDGIVGNSSLREGNFVHPGAVLFSIVPTNHLYVKANFKETQISKFKPGMKADIKVDAESKVKITGVIRSIAPATGAKFSLLPPANATGNFTKIVQRVPVTIDFSVPEGYEGKIVPGMSTLTTIRIDQ